MQHSMSVVSKLHTYSICQCCYYLHEKVFLVRLLIILVFIEKFYSLKFRCVFFVQKIVFRNRVDGFGKSRNCICSRIKITHFSFLYLSLNSFICLLFNVYLSCNLFIFIPFHQPLSLFFMSIFI